MRNDKWRRIEHGRKGAHMGARGRKRLVCEGAKEDGDLLYDALANPSDEGDEFIDVGQILEPSTTYISDDLQASLLNGAKKVGALLSFYDESLLESLPIQQYSRYYKVLNDAINTIWYQMLGLYDCLDIDLICSKKK